MSETAGLYYQLPGANGTYVPGGLLRTCSEQDSLCDDSVPASGHVVQFITNARSEMQSLLIPRLPLACSAGFYGVAGEPYNPSFQRSATCTAPCPRGHYCPEGSIEPIPCRPGTFNPSLGGTAIESCIPCQRGSYCSGAASSPTSCLDDFYQAELGKAACLPCTKGSFCPAGSIRPQDKLCADGTYLLTSNTSSPFRVW